MKVWIQLETLEERTYENIARIDDSNKYKITVYGENDSVLAIINKGDLKNLLTEDNSGS